MKGNALPLRTKNSSLSFLACVLALGLVCTAGNASAQVIGSDGSICPNYSGFLAKLVPCIGNVVVNATQYYLVNYIGYFVATVNVVLAAAVLFYGFSLFTGRTRSASREGVILALKIGGVALGMNSLVQLFPVLLDSIGFLVNTVSFYLPNVMQQECPYANGLWETVDCTLAQVVGGIYPGYSVSNGMLGFLVASLFSGPIGVATFFLGLGVVMVLLLTLFQAVFILLSTYIALALLMGIAPLAVPLVALKATKGYFEKWLRLLLTVILQPMFLFAYLTMLLLMMEVVVFTGPYSLYRAISCNAVNGNWGGSGFNIGNYLVYSGAVAERTGYNMSVNQSPSVLGPVSGVSNTGTPGKAALGTPGTNITSLASVNGRLLGNIGIEVPTAALNYDVLAAGCGMSTSNYVLNLLFSFIMAAAVAYVMYTLIAIIPFLGASMTGELFGIQQIANSQFSRMASSFGNKPPSNSGFAGAGSK